MMGHIYAESEAMSAQQVAYFKKIVKLMLNLILTHPHISQNHRQSYQDQGIYSATYPRYAPAFFSDLNKVEEITAITNHVEEMIQLNTSTTSYGLCVPRSLSTSSDYTEDYYLGEDGTMLRLIQDYDLKIVFARMVKDVHDKTRVFRNKQERTDFTIEHS